MPADLARAADFLAAHGRLLDRRRFARIFGGDPPEGVLGALEGHRNPDGGYGWGLEPDLRDARSQPGGALHAFEALADAAPATSPRAAELCDWLASVSLPGTGGALPFALPVASDVGVAPFWASADPTEPSLHITAAVLGPAHRVARHDPAVAAHPWLAGATRWALDRVGERAPSSTLELLFVLTMLDVVAPTDAEAAERLAAWAAHLPADGTMHVEGGTEDEAMRPIDFSLRPDGPLRARFDADAVAADLDRLASGQRDDGGWAVDHLSYSPAAALEWRGYATVAALTTLRDNGRLAPAGADR
jgi:hypothetical protein